MADFGSILNPNNKTLNLYCNSIITNQQNIQNPYLYAGASPFAYNEPLNMPIVYNDLIGQDITASQFPKIKFSKPGIYNIIAALSGGATFASVTLPMISLKIFLYDEHDTLLNSAVCPSTNTYKIYIRTYLSTTAIFNIAANNYLIVSVSIEGAPPEFNISFDNGSISINKI
jgi:hypothetical protein